MNKNMTDKDRKQKPLYKNVWFWIAIVISVIANWRES